MKFTLLVSALGVLAVAHADMSRIADILTAESNDLNNCDLLKTNSQLSLGHKIAQVVCDTKTSEMERRFISFVKYILFGIICSISTYLVFGSSETKAVDYTVKEHVESEDEQAVTPEGPVVEKQESASLEPELKQVSLAAVKLEQMNVLPVTEIPEIEEDLSLEKKSLDSTNAPAINEENEELQSEEEKHLERDYEKAEFSEFVPAYPQVLHLEENELVDFEVYKTHVERAHTQYFRPRSFSDPKGCERYVQYPFTIEDAIQTKRIGESPDMFTMPLNVVPTVAAEIYDDMPEPGSPHHSQLNLNGDVAHAEPGSLKQIPPEQKINERKPMVFVGGVSASTTPMELVNELKKQGFNVTVVPRIRYGVSFGFCPDLVLSSQAEVEKLLAMGRVWVKDRWVDIRPYIPKEEPQMQGTFSSGDSTSMESKTPQQVTSPTTHMVHDVVENNVEYITHEDLMSSCPTSPAPSQNATPPIGNSSPITPGTPHHFIPHMNPPIFQMTPVIPFSPQNYPPHMVQTFFPHPQEHYVFAPHQMNGMNSPSPPEQHPMQMYDEHLSPCFQPVESNEMNLQHPISNNGGGNQVFKLVSN